MLILRHEIDILFSSLLNTVANFSPEHSGTEKDQRGYPLCFKSEIFIIKSFNT